MSLPALKTALVPWKHHAAHAGVKLSVDQRVGQVVVRGGDRFFGAVEGQRGHTGFRIGGQRISLMRITLDLGLRPWSGRQG
jgi:hypothetical protein